MPPLRIAVDGHRLIDEPRTSGATYLRSLLSHWSILSNPPTILLLVPRSVDTTGFDPMLRKDIEFIAPTSPCVPTASYRAQFHWQQIVIPRLLRKCRPNVYLSPFHLTPQMPLGVKIVTTIHDLCFLTEPQFSKGALIHRMQVISACVRARRLLCVSHFTHTMLSKWWPWAGRKATTVHNGIKSETLSDTDADAQLRKIGTVEPYRYFLWIGNPVPRKNPTFLFDIFASYRTEQTSQRFVIVAPAPTHERLQRFADDRGIERDIILLSSVDDVTRNTLYKCATALVFPSLCEGFAYPVLEAMTQGCPVICHVNGPARELLGNILTLPNRFEPMQYVALMRYYASLEREQRKDLAQKLISGSKSFSEQRMAAETLAVLKEIVGKV